MFSFNSSRLFCQYFLRTLPSIDIITFVTFKKFQMTLENRLNTVIQLAESLNIANPEVQAIMKQAELHNPWFTIENQKRQ